MTAGPGSETTTRRRTHRWSPRSEFSTERCLSKAPESRHVIVEAHLCAARPVGSGFGSSIQHEPLETTICAGKACGAAACAVLCSLRGSCIGTFKSCHWYPGLSNYYCSATPTNEKSFLCRANRAERLRVQALKNDDQEAYLKMVAESKNERLKTLLGKTDELLERLGQMVQLQKETDDIDPVEERLRKKNPERHKEQGQEVSPFLSVRSVFL